MPVYYFSFLGQRFSTWYTVTMLPVFVCGSKRKGFVTLWFLRKRKGKQLSLKLASTSYFFQNLSKIVSFFSKRASFGKTFSLGPHFKFVLKNQKQKKCGSTFSLIFLVIQRKRISGLMRKTTVVVCLQVLHFWTKFLLHIVRKWQNKILLLDIEKSCLFL